MNRGEKLKLGIFLVVSALIVVLVLTTFGGLSLFGRDVRYFVNVPGGVGGLERGSPVQLRGVRVGTVGGFDLYPEDFDGVRVSLAVSPDAQIRHGARASMTLQGLSGLKQLSIDPGPPGAALLPPGETIPYAESPMQRITGSADELIGRAMQLLEELGTSSQRLSAILHAVEPAQVARVLEHAEQVASGARETERKLDDVLDVARRSLRQTSARTGAVLAAAEQAAGEARSAFAGADRLSRRVDQLARATDDQMRGAAFELHEASRSLEQFAREIRQQPSRLLFSGPPPERVLP